MISSIKAWKKIKVLEIGFVSTTASDGDTANLQTVCFRCGHHLKMFQCLPGLLHAWNKYQWFHIFVWKVKSSKMWHSVTGSIVPDVSKTVLPPSSESNCMTLKTRAVWYSKHWKSLSSDTAHLIRLESSATPIWEPQIQHIYFFHYLLLTTYYCGDKLYFRGASGHWTSEAAIPVSFNLREKVEMTSHVGKYQSPHRMGLL
jgi:hypothetical protein